MKAFTCFFFFAILLLSESASATRPEPNLSRGKSTNHPKYRGGSGNTGGGATGGFFGFGNGFGIPGFGKGITGGGYGVGFGGPNGGYTEGGITRPSVVCREKGPCHRKKLTCPAKCFTSYSRSGRGYGGGGGGGGCTFDCKKWCVAYC